MAGSSPRTLVTACIPTLVVTFLPEGAPGVHLGFQLRSQAPGQSLRMTMPHLLPGTIKPGSAVYVGTTLSNIWIQNNQVDLDYEMLDTHLGFSYGINDRIGFALVYDQRDFSGGTLDGFIQGFHDIFSIEQNGRDLVPRGRALIEFRDETGTVLANPDPSEFENSAITIIGQYNIILNPEKVPVFNLSSSVRHALEPPVGSDSDDDFDWNVAVGLAVELSTRLRSCYHLGYTKFGQTDIVGLTFEEDAYSFIAAFAWRLNSQFSAMAQYLWNEEALEGFDSFSKSSNEMDLGLQWFIPREGYLEFAIVENFITLDNSPDFGLHLAYSRQL